jgi:hypothetical protein
LAVIVASPVAIILAVPGLIALPHYTGSFDHRVK